MVGGEQQRLSARVAGEEQRRGFAEQGESAGCWSGTTFRTKVSR